MGEKYDKAFATEIRNILVNEIQFIDMGYYHLLKRCFEEQRLISHSLSEHIKRNNEIFNEIKIE